MPDAKNEVGSVQANDEWPIAPQYLRQISVHPAFFIGPKT